MGVLGRLGYGLSQSARVAWYMGHYIAAARMEDAKGEEPPPARPTPDRAALLGAIRALFAEDWRNIEAGVYAMPHDLVGSPMRLAERSLRFFRDVPRVTARRAARNAAELRGQGIGANGAHYPPYYLQNFHFQTDGYLSPESAALYDFQVETLFSGAADAMRRQALVPLKAEILGRDQRGLALLDIACGTGRFLSFVKDNYPRLPVAGLDLSPDYLAWARRLLARFGGVDLFRANAEALPLADASQDIVSVIFLFHELPGQVRRHVVAEIARVLKPGGALLFIDSLQLGDLPSYDGLLELFPERFHEPYYRSYLSEDLAALFAAAGLQLESTRTAFLSKLCVVRKP
jgi:ubiquinone/menaquinone biosynthesis C-methylase UbiE